MSLGPSTARERRGKFERFQAITAEELAAFEVAWQKDSAIQVGGRTYSSDLAPLMDESQK